jgi:hypothetical protein
VTAVTYTGAETLSYPGYVDLATGMTLTCHPGGRTYDIASVNGDFMLPGDGRFTRSMPVKEESVPGEPEEETPEEIPEER